MSQSRSLRLIVQAMVAAAALVGTPAAAQQAASAPAGDVQAALVKDVGNLSDKFAGLARVMDGKYDWRPMEGVRSVSDVFNLIVSENRMLAGLLSGTAGQGRGGGMRGAQPITDAAAMQEALRRYLRRRAGGARRPVSRRAQRERHPLRPDHDQAGRGVDGPARSARTPRPVDRLRAHQSRRPPLEQVGARRGSGAWRGRRAPGDA